MNIDYEDEYSCSRRSIKSKDTSFVLAEFQRLTTNATVNAKSEIPHHLDIEYGESDRQRYDIYGTDLPSESGIVVFIHGGYWQDLDKSSGAPLALPLYRKGLKLVVVDYDLAPQVKLRDIVGEVQKFGRHILEVAVSLGSKGVWIAGHSAGAHLASCLLHPTFQETLKSDQKNLLKGLILISGIYDVTPIVETSINQPLQLTVKEAESVSTQSLFDIKQKVKILVTLGSEESSEFHRQAQDVHQRAIKAGTVSELIILEKNDHFTIIEKLNDADFQLSRKIVSFVEN